MTARWMLTLAALNGAVAVALGAFGAHALKARLGPDLLAVWQTAVQYHFVHLLALALCGVLALRPPVAADAWLNGAAIAFLLGMLLFSGSLYALALTGVRGLGAITPLGGVAFIIGWLLLTVSLWR